MHQRARPTCGQEPVDPMTGLAVVPRKIVAVREHVADTGGFTGALESVRAQVLPLGERRAVGVELELDEMLP